MTLAALTRLFLLFSGVSLLFNASTVSYIQGGVIFSEAFSESKLIAAFYGIFICGPLLIITLTVCGLHARRSQGHQWADRMPLVWISETDDGPQDRRAWETQAYLILTFVIFVLAPIYGIGHMANTLIDDGWVRQKDDQAFPIDQYPPVALLDALPVMGAGWSSPTIQADGDGAVLRLGYETFDQSGETIDWLPLLTPTGLAIILGGVIYAFSWCLWGLLRTRSAYD